MLGLDSNQIIATFKLLPGFCYMSKAKKSLTTGQRRVFNTIIHLIKRNGYPPTTRELAAELGIKAPSVHEQLNRLQKKGFINKQKNKARSIEVLKRPASSIVQTNSAKFTQIPVIGEIAAGLPLFATENYSGKVRVKADISRRGKIFGLKVKGDSMIGSGIDDGDIVVVRQQPAAEHGEIVVVLLGEEATVKKISYSGDVVRLIASNPAYSPINVDVREDFRILGKVLTWVKKENI
jgi:repressor LexA